MTVMTAGELEGKTRADLLEICRRLGHKATAWKRDRMFAVLTGTEVVEAVAVVKKNVLADQLESREAGDSAARALALMAERTGSCLSIACKQGCEAYEVGEKDAFGWQMCLCGHTQHAHAKPVLA